MSALRVLLIGSDSAETQGIGSVLLRADHAVVPVPTFAEASEALSLQRFDAVLITATLSTGGVKDFTAQLRIAEKHQRNAVRTPVLFVLEGSSTIASNSNGRLDLNGAVDAYLPERFGPAEFAQTVENLADALAESNKLADGFAPAPELPVFSVADFEEQVAYDRELMVEIIDLFLVERVHDEAEMTESLKGGDLQQLMRSAHTIKGSLGSLHANLARFRSQELESAAKNGNQQACVSLLTALKQDLNNLEPELLSLRASVLVAS